MSDEKNTSDAKQRAARAAAALVENGMIVGLGSGTTADLVIAALGKRVADEGLKILCVATSVATADRARSLGIPLRELDDIEAVDLNIDGADEVDPSFRMIKGRGGALLREKLVVSAARRRVTVITPEKRVVRLGETARVPLEISPIGARHTERRIKDLGAETTPRRNPDGSPFVTDGGNRIIDCRFLNVDNIERLDERLHQTVGVFETGLFIGLCDMLVVGRADGVEEVPNAAGKRA